MTISGIGLQDVNGLQSIGSLLQIQQNTTNSTDPISTTSSSSVPASDVRISGPGQFMSNLQSLLSQNPSQFQQVVSQMATQVQQTAQQVGGAQGQQLDSFAAKLQQAAQTDSLAPLQPSQSANGGVQGAYGQNNSVSQLMGAMHGGRHGHHHSGSVSASDGSQSSGNSQNSSSSQSPIASLFQTLNTELTQALTGSGSPSS